MIELLDEYKSVVELVLKESPVSTIERILGSNSFISAGDVLQLGINLAKHWSDFKDYNVPLTVVLVPDDSHKSEKFILSYDFGIEIRAIKQDCAGKSCVYFINKEYEIIDINLVDDFFDISKGVNYSEKMNSIVFVLGIKGIDTIINGNVTTSENFAKSYEDLIDSRKMLSITNYKKLIKNFFEKNVQYDPYKKYFVRKTDIPKQFHNDTINKKQKLLRSKPEELFQIDFVNYLKEHCCDLVAKEYKNNNEDRYDVLVLCEKDIYIFEIKWLGCSVTSNMKVFQNYNTSERAIEGAYQLLDYLENGNKYKQYFLEYEVFCAILLIFDAREEDEDICYPDEIVSNINIDLSQRLFIERKKISASDRFKHEKGKGHIK